MTGAITDQFTINALPDDAPDTARVFTQGLTQVGYPDLEWYWSPKETWTEAAQLLNRIARYMVEFGTIINPGETMSIEGTQMSVEFLEPLARDDHDSGDHRMLRVRTITMGAKGVRVFRALTGAGRGDSSKHNQRALGLQLQGKWEDARLAYEQALALDPGNIYALNNLGYLLLRQGNVEDALQLIQRAIEIEPTYALAHNNLGNAYLNLGRAEEAMAEYQAAIAADLNYAMPHRNLALVYCLLGQRDEAIAEYQKYFELAPAETKDYDAHYNLAVMLSEGGQEDEAIEQYEKALAINPQFAKAWNNLGLIYFSRGELEQAAQFYSKAVAADAEFAVARYNLGITLAAQGDYQRAIEELETLRAQQPGLAQAVSNLGVLYTTVQRFDDAIGIFEDLTATEADNPTLFFNLGLAYESQGRRAEAERALRRVIELEPPQSRRALRAQQELAAWQSAAPSAAKAKPCRQANKAAKRA